MHEHYPTLLEMVPWHKKYPITRWDGWKVFHGPKIGKKIEKEAYLVLRSNEPKISWQALLVSGKLLVLCFDGIHHDDTTGHAKTLVDDLNSRYADKLNAYAVTTYYDSSKYDSDSHILGDMDNKLHRIFAATGQCIYVLDNHGVVVWKSAGYMKEELVKWLDSGWK